MQYFKIVKFSISVLPSHWRLRRIGLCWSAKADPFYVHKSSNACFPELAQLFMQSLKHEYAVLLAENKKRYPEYKQAKAKMMELLTAKNNVERILGVAGKEKNHDRQQEAR